jgi:hypothetical protein
VAQEEEYSSRERIAAGPKAGSPHLSACATGLCADVMSVRTRL